MDGMVPDYLIWIKVESEGLTSGFRKVAVRLFRVFIKKLRSLLDELLDIICNCCPEKQPAIIQKAPFCAIVTPKIEQQLHTVEMLLRPCAN